MGVPASSENARNFKLLYRVPNFKEQPNERFELEKIPTTGTPTITVQWDRPEKFLPSVPDHFATALLAARIKDMTLSAGANHLNLAIFVFFFTIRGSDAVYFPSLVNQPKIVMPVRFTVELWAEAMNKPITLLKTFVIDARTWDNVSVIELSNAP